MVSTPRSWVPLLAEACSPAFIHFNRTLPSAVMKGKKSYGSIRHIHGAGEEFWELKGHRSVTPERFRIAA